MNNSQKLDTLETFAKSGVFRSSDTFTQACLAARMVDLQKAATRDAAWVEANLRLHLPELMRRLAVHKRSQRQARPQQSYRTSTVAADGAVLWTEHSSSSDMIYRNGQSINLRQMQADLEADNRRLEELRRRVARERRGS